MAIGLQLLCEFTGSPILPHDRVMNRFSGLPVPNHDRLALIRDSDRRNFVDGDAGFLNRRSRRPDLLLPDLGGVVFDEPGTRKELGEFGLIDTLHPTLRIEDDRATTAGPFVECEHVAFGHR